MSELRIKKMFNLVFTRRVNLFSIIIYKNLLFFCSSKIRNENSNLIVSSEIIFLVSIYFTAQSNPVLFKETANKFVLPDEINFLGEKYSFQFGTLDKYRKESCTKKAIDHFKIFMNYQYEFFYFLLFRYLF